jgi:NADH dehydrogenase
VRVYLLEALPDILPELDPALRRAARTRLANERIEVLTGAMAEEITAKCVKLKGGREISTENVIWTAGNRPNMAIKNLGLPFDERTGIPVDLTLRVEGHEDIWAIGDCAAVQDVRQKDSRIVPPTAQAAIQEGHVVARNVIKTVDGENDFEEFTYKPLGQLVELGSDFAVNEVMGVRFSGALAAVFWRLTYLVRLNSPQSKARVAADWVLGIFLRPAVTQTRATSDE